MKEINFLRKFIPVFVTSLFVAAIISMSGCDPKLKQVQIQVGESTDSTVCDSAVSIKVNTDSAVLNKVVTGKTEDGRTYTGKIVGVVEEE